MARTTGLEQLGEKLEKLVPMLGSPEEGEQLATVDAIRRALDAAGLDWHHLAEAVKTSKSFRSEAYWRICAGRALVVGRWALNETEIDFLQGMLRWRGEPTEKQADWMEKIFGAVLEEVRT